MLEDQQGAIAYGYVAHRVFYARFVGHLSAELGTHYLNQLEAAIGQVPAIAYFADGSALREYDLVARTRFARFVLARRVKFTSLVILTWRSGVGPAARAFADSLGASVDLLSDPLEFERALGNVAPLAERGPRGAGAIEGLPQVWQVHAPG